MKQVWLTRGFSALVDDEDYEMISQWKWHARTTCNKVYAARGKHPGGVIFMHRLINGTPDGMETDHIDGNGLNNQRSNLRSATSLQNSMNSLPQHGRTSSLKGVWKDVGSRNRKHWRSAIRINGKLKYLGRFHTEEEAHEAYKMAALEHFGEFCRTSEGNT